MPDPGQGPLRWGAFCAVAVHHGRVLREQVQVLPGANPALGEVGAGLLDSQRQVPQLSTQRAEPVQVTGMAGSSTAMVVSQNPTDHLERLAGRQNIQPDGIGGEVVPASGAPASDQYPARRIHPGQQRFDVTRVGDVIQDQQPPGMGAQPLSGTFDEHLQRGTDQARLQRNRQSSEPGVQAGPSLGAPGWPDPAGVRRWPTPERVDVGACAGGGLSHRLLHDTFEIAKLLGVAAGFSSCLATVGGLVLAVSAG